MPHRNVEAVTMALTQAGLDSTVRHMESSTHTAQDAAQALGCELGAIVKSLVFMADDEAVLVLASGDHRVDADFVAEKMGWGQMRSARPEEVLLATGQPIGGVAPLGHPGPLPTLIDRALSSYPIIWAAAGANQAVFSTTFGELVRLCHARALTVSRSEAPGSP
ncbi:MAG: YbaK/EbsC family protein [Acidimicrobiales bacterium]